jgi:hypothetical protein
MTIPAEAEILEPPSPQPYAVYRSPLMPGTPPEQAVPFLQALIQSEPSPARRGAARVMLSGMPTVSSTTDDPSVPIGLADLSPGGLVAGIFAREEKEIAAIKNQPALKGMAPHMVDQFTRRQLAVRATEREQIIEREGLAAKHHQAVQRFLNQNPFPPFSYSDDQHRVALGAGEAVRNLLPADALLFLQHALGNPANIDVVRPILERIAKSPPRTWTEETVLQGSQTALARAHELLMTLPPSPRAVAMERHKRAKTAAAESYLGFARLIHRYIERGTLND